MKIKKAVNPILRKTISTRDVKTEDDRYLLVDFFKLLLEWDQETNALDEHKCEKQIINIQK